MQIQSTYKPSALQFSPSQIFFDKQKALLKNFGFFSASSIDLYIKYSFQLVEEQYFIKWWEILAYNMDHEIQEQWMVYQLWILTPLQVAISARSIDLKDPSFRFKDSIFAYFRNFPLWQWGGFIFFVCLLWFAWKFWQVLLIINIIWLVLMCFYSIIKTIQYFITLFKKNTKTYKGISINYTHEEDLCILTDDLIHFLPTLQEYHIDKIAYTGNCFYFYQTLKKKGKNLFSKEIPLTDQEKSELTQKTLWYLQHSSFLPLVTKS